MKLKLIEIPTIEVRNDAAVVIFPSRPYWFSATSEIKDILDILEREIDTVSTEKEISAKINISISEAQETLMEIRELLYSNCVLLVDGRLNVDSQLIEPDFQVNAVENVLVIAGTQKCNLACPQCYAKAKNPMKNEMTTGELKQLIDELDAMPWKNDVSRVGLTGGEFFSRADAIEIIDYVHAKGFKVLVSSNGLLLTEETIRHLSRYPNLKMSISLDGPVSEPHEKIRGAGTFVPTVEAISRLSASGVFVGVNMFIYQDNVDLIDETLHLTEGLGVQAFNCLNMMHVGRANSRQSRATLQRVPEHILYRKLFEILRGNMRYQQMMYNSTFANQIMGIAAGVKSKYCGIGTNRALYVKPNGDLYPCPDTVLPNFRLGNVRKNNLWDIWENSTLLRQLRQLDVDIMNSECSQCDVRYFCGGGCRGENYQVTKSLSSAHFNCREMRDAILELMWILTEEPTFFQDKVQDLYQKTCV